MREINSELLRGVVEVDETYVGGKVRGHGTRLQGEQGYRYRSRATRGQNSSASYPAR